LEFNWNLVLGIWSFLKLRNLLRNKLRNLLRNLLRNFHLSTKQKIEDGKCLFLMKVVKIGGWEVLPMYLIIRSKDDYIFNS